MSDYTAFAGLYDLFYDDFTQDIPMYRGFAERVGSHVLELGCGTGRVAIPLARDGCSVTGIDVAEAMLAIARGKVERADLADRVKLLQADMRRFDLGARFDLAIVPINTFMHNATLDDQLDTLSCLRRHLAPHGLLVLDLFNPDVHASNEGRLVLHRTRPGPHGQLILQFTARSLDWENQVSSVMFIVDEPDEGGLIRRTTFPFQMRFLFRNEVELLLRLAGFELEAVYGSYDLEPYGEGAEKMIVVANPARPTPPRPAPPARVT
ncbi:MAG TPA: class I SAM-dependent methyltransferase [Anaerolineae bacterium]|nr:class I SAM-dependent methyltransferase [Anaerolineae bacterium]